MNPTPEPSQPHLLFIVSYPLSEPVLRNRMSVFIRGFLERGGKVTLVCPYEPDYDFYTALAITNPAQFDAIEVATPPVQGVPFWRRAWLEWSIAGALITAADKFLKTLPGAPGVVVSVPSMFLLMRLRILQASIAFLAIDIRDLTWEYLSSSSPILRVVKQVLKWRSIKQLKLANLISVTNPREYRYVAENITGNSTHGPLLLEVSNGISKQQLETLQQLPAQKRYNGSLDILYIGNLGHAQDLSTLLHAAKELPQHRFTLVGSGGEIEKLRHLAEDLSLSNVDLPGRCRWSEVYAYYEQADVLFAQLTPSYQSAVPSKLYEYLVAGRPIIYAGEGYAKQVLSGFAGVRFCAPQSVPSLQACLLKLENEISEGTALSQQDVISNRAHIASHFTRETATVPWLQSVTALFEGPL